MSREDLVFTRRALVVVAVLSTLGSVGLAGAVVAWRTAVAISSIEAKASAAVARVEATVQVVQLAQVGHEREDKAVTAAIIERIGRIEDWREAVEPRLAGWRVRMDALPADRRRPRALAPDTGDGG